MKIDDEEKNRGYGEEGRTQEEQDRAAEGGGDTPSPDLEETTVPPTYRQRPATDHSEVKERSDVSAGDGQPDTGS